MKRLLFTLLISCVLLFFIPITTKAATFTDIPSNSGELKAAVEYLHKNNIISGFSDQTFRPNMQITREQFAVILSRAMKLDTSTAKSNFPDVKESSVYYKHISKLTELKIINGFPNGYFYPKQHVTREQAAIMLNKAFELRYTEDILPFSDVKSSSEQHIKALYFNGITSGTTSTTFSPNTNITRGQASIFIYRIKQMSTRGNVAYLKAVNYDVEQLEIVASEGKFVRYVLSKNGLRIIPIGEGSGRLLLKGASTATTVPIDQYIAISVQTSERNGKFFVEITEEPIMNMLEHTASFYRYNQLNMNFIPTSVQITNQFEVPLQTSHFYVAKNDDGIEISIFEPGKYTVQFINGSNKMQFKANVTLQNFTTTTLLSR